MALRAPGLDVTVPRAVGAHAPYPAVPQHVRAWVDDTLGSPVVSVAEQVGGMSPGCATRVVCADGTRAFVKAVGDSLNVGSPVLFRREVEALTLLGPHPLWAELLAHYDDGDWVALVLEDVEGTHPDLSDDPTMERVLAQTDELVAVLAARVPEPPTPGAVDDNPPLFRPGPVDLNASFRSAREGLHLAAGTGTDLVPSWVVDRMPDLSPLTDALVAQPNEQAVHFDIRDDNLIQRPSGELVFVDWGAFGVGPAWLDPLLARLERVDSRWFDDSLASSPALRTAGDEVVTGWLLTAGANLAWRAHSDATSNLPTLQAFRRRESARFLGAAARRLDLRH